MGWKGRLTEWVRTQGQKNTALSYFIQFIYHFFANSYIQAGISILGTIIIAVLIGTGSYGVLFWVCVVCYCIMTILSAWANEHIREKIRDTKAFQKMLYGIGTSMRTWSISLQKSASYLRNTHEKKNKEILKKLDRIDFQAAAFMICETLCSYLSKNEEKNDVYVTIFQRRETDSCEMIAHSANHEVSTYGVKYPIPPQDQAIFGKVEYHSYMFASGKKEITTFPTHDLVMEAFVIHDKSKGREENIQQYICIPISPAKLGITFLLQVDTNVPNFFGDSQKAVDDFAQNIIYPFAQMLHMMYEQARLIEQLVS